MMKAKTLIVTAKLAIEGRPPYTKENVDKELELAVDLTDQAREMDSEAVNRIISSEMATFHSRTAQRLVMVRTLDEMKERPNEVIATPVEEPAAAEPIPMLLYCPECCARHVDVHEWATTPHRSHVCQECGHIFRPALVATVGVIFLPGTRNEGS